MAIFNADAQTLIDVIKIYLYSYQLFNDTSSQYNKSINSQGKHPEVLTTWLLQYISSWDV